jgi:signal transduction histidine kinase
MRRRLAIITIAFCISFASMIGLSLFSMGRFAMFSNYTSQVDHSGMVIMAIRSAEVRIRDIGLCERGYMISRDTMYLRLLSNAVDSLNKAMDEVKILTADNPKQQKNIVLLKGSVALRMAAARSNIAYVDSSGSSTRSKFYDDSRELMRECSARLRDMRLLENQLLSERTQGEQYYQKRTNLTLTNLLIIFCLVTFVLFVIMIKELRSRMLFQEELQVKIIDLKRSHNELQEIAYAASHDLQEPLRKIQVFSDMLLYQKAAYDEDCNRTLSRISHSASKMQQLITDLLSLTSLANTDEPKNPVDLNILVRSILVEIHDRITEKGASVELQPLPVIDGYQSQLVILFKAILDNSLKFTREGVSPVITISSEILNGHELSEINPDLPDKKFYRITCSDNGIGFDNKFISKIFRIFQRLHTHESEYGGKGIGLAICQRVMANHKGYLIAHGEPQMGAHFKLFFPLDE